MKILVVEDDELIAQTLSAILSMYHYAVEVVHDGLSALEMIEAFDFDVVLLDVLLPKLNGLEVCKKARQNGSQVPILMLTARDSSQDKAAGLDAGADDYLVKPFDPEELIARVRALLRRGRLTQNPTLGLGKLVLDPESCEVKYDGTLIPLTPKEYALLELFLRNPKRVYSCGMILEHLWTHDETPGEEAVRTHIKGLRHKLKTSGAGSDLIATVYGIGYRLKPQPGKTLPKASTVSPEHVHGGESSSAPDNSHILSAKIQDLWTSHQTTVSEQVNLIEVAVEAASAQTLSRQSRETAIRNAHSLAGSLGTFGVQSGSKIARSIELILMSDTPLATSDIRQLQQWVQGLRQAILDKSVALDDSTDPATFVEKTFIVFSKDASFIQALTELTEQIGYSLQTSSSLKNAITLVENIQPAGLFLDPTVAPSQTKLQSLIEELNALAFNIPLVIYSSNATEARIAKRGVEVYYLQKAFSKYQLLQSIRWLIEQNQSIEATIVAVDDDPSILGLLRVLLEPWGMLVHTLSDPRQFWPLIELAQPNLIILDVEMPTHNGIELCKLLRNNISWSEVPVLFLTVHGNEAIINEIFRAGADDYIQKPLLGPELVTRILNRLERSRLVKRLRSVPPPTDVSQSRVTNPPQDILPPYEKLFPNAIINILNVADDAIICIDHNQKIIFFNGGAEHIFGYSAQEILGHALDGLMPKRHVIAHRQHVKEFGKSHQTAKQMGDRREIYGLRKDGTEFPAEASIAQLWEGDNAIYAVILRDISQRQQEEIRKNDFISVISHEFRTPLTAILGSLEILTRGLKQNDAQETDQLLAIAVSSTERLVHLVNSIIEIERIESGASALNRELYDLADLATEAVAAMDELATHQGVLLATELHSVTARVDRDRMIQTLTSLLSNAIRFSAPGQTVLLKLNTNRHQAQFEVIDQGPGISADRQEHIFKKFHVSSLENTTVDYTKGLSLAICQSIIQQHQGSIWVESEKGQGSHFFVTLPKQASR